jgi:hypothetical protein
MVIDFRVPDVRRAHKVVWNIKSPLDKIKQIKIKFIK